jgi:hypothetical protein
MNNRFTEAEDLVIRKNWGDLEAGAIAYRLHRPKSSITGRAKRLGLLSANAGRKRLVIKIKHQGFTLEEVAKQQARLARFEKAGLA